MASGFDDTDTVMNAVPGARTAVRRQPRIAWRDSSGVRHLTIERVTLLGSASGADVVMNDSTVSRLHAELDPRQGGLWVRDLGSRNGTFVQGVEVGSARVPDGGRIQIGTTTITVDDAVETTIELWPEAHFGPLVGASMAMRELFATLAKLARLETTVLIAGETGTGKELVARAIHDASSRADGPLVIVDCAALPEHLLESELFGHAKGAFTGATGARIGAMEAASGGTVFLDEVGELPLGMQPKLLRVLESRTVRRVGETSHRPVDVRFVSATNRDLKAMVNARAFREDLYFRLAVLPVTVPPLRQRMDDVPALVDHFQPNAPAEWKRELLHEVIDRSWLGNVRELRNFVERALAFGTKRAAAMSIPGIDADVPPSTADSDAFAGAFEKPFREFRDEIEREYVRRLLDRHGGNVTAAAQAAGIDRTYIYRLVRKHEG